jgi:PEGA domain
MKRFLLACVAALVLTAPLAAQRRVVIVQPGFGWGWGGWYAPYWGPYPYGFYDGYDWPRTGTVKLDSHVKDAEVYIDGAYAGKVGKLKSMNLRPGSYNIEVRSPGQTSFEQKVFVVAGKTIHVKPVLHAQAQP